MYYIYGGAAEFTVARSIAVDISDVFSNSDAPYYCLQIWFTFYESAIRPCG